MQPKRESAAKDAQIAALREALANVVRTAQRGDSTMTDVIVVADEALHSKTECLDSGASLACAEAKGREEARCAAILQSGKDAQDAARYRWLRAQADFPDGENAPVIHFEPRWGASGPMAEWIREKLDEAIDAEMATETPERRS